MAGETISDWVIALEKAGLEELAKRLHSEKIGDYTRLRESGLPVFDDFNTSYNRFSEDNPELMEFLAKYKSLVIRAIPATPKLPRRYKIGVKGFEECRRFLENIHYGREEGDYSMVLLTEHELTGNSGIIISNDKGVRIEVGDCDLDELSHGAYPSSSCVIDLTGVGHVSDKTYWERRSSEGERLIQRALRHLELSRDSFNPLFMRGYFEFIVTAETGRIRFLDYKVNEMYLK